MVMAIPARGTDITAATVDVTTVHGTLGEDGFSCPQSSSEHS